MPEIIADIIPGTQAMLNITWRGQNGELPDPIHYDSTDDQIRRWATEAIRGGIPGIAADPMIEHTALADNVVTRFPATDDLPNRVMIRPKTAFGA